MTRRLQADVEALTKELSRVRQQRTSAHPFSPLLARARIHETQCGHSRLNRRLRCAVGATGDVLRVECKRARPSSRGVEQWQRESKRVSRRLHDAGF